MSASITELNADRERILAGFVASAGMQLAPTMRDALASELAFADAVVDFRADDGGVGLLVVDSGRLLVYRMGAASVEVKEYGELRGASLTRRRDYQEDKLADTAWTFAHSDLADGFVRIDPRHLGDDERARLLDGLRGFIGSGR
jgi:hypothetical protein